MITQDESAFIKVGVGKLKQTGVVQNIVLFWTKGKREMHEFVLVVGRWL